MENLTPTVKGLFSQLLNFNKKNNNKLTISNDNFIIILNENDSNVKCYKKIAENDWEYKNFDSSKALSLFNLCFIEDNNDTSEEDEVNVDGEDYGN